MAERKYRPGEVLFRQDEPSDVVGRIVSGDVEVVKERGDQAVVLGRIGPGEYVGEMGVLEGRPRSATVRAIGAVIVDLVGKEDFLHRIAEDRDTAFALMVRLSARLRSVDDALAEADSRRAGTVEAPAPSASEVRPAARLTVFADSDRLTALLPADGYTLDALPFFVGRLPDEGETRPPIRIDFTLRDQTPYRLSPVHFALMEQDGAIIVRDFGSEFGTEVNGEILGGDFFRTDSTPLEPGDNLVIAGGAGSPYVFRIRLD
ncbi:MAG: cyclic nucleotide-binding domain-containing protein [Alphaproteobacteria bacterium]